MDRDSISDSRAEKSRPLPIIGVGRAMVQSAVPDKPLDHRPARQAQRLGGLSGIFAPILEAGEKWRKWTEMEKNGGPAESPGCTVTQPGTG
jgi:hypothetical protein